MQYGVKDGTIFAWHSSSSGKIVAWESTVLML